MPVHFTDEEFDAAVEWAIGTIPQQFLDQLDNVFFAVEDEPPAGQHPDTLGLYEGVALTKRANYGACDELPDCISIFKGPHERLSDDRDTAMREIRRTVVHEVGHHFGMNEEQIAAMGYR